MIPHSNNNLDRVSILLLIVSGILTGISYLFMQFSLAWFCLIPLFYLLERQNWRKSFLCGTLYGVVTASILYYWVIPIATRYSGGFTFYSILLYGGVVLYFSVYCAVFGAGYHVLHSRSENRILSGLSVAGFFVLLELIRMKLLPGSPWCHYNLALTQAQHRWTIQWAAIGGFPLITFAIVFPSYIITQWLLKREPVLLWTAAFVLAVFFVGGFLLSIASHEVMDERYDVVLLNDNIPAETRWEEHTGDSLANLLFKMNEDAVLYDPDLIVWSETAIPWKLEPDEEFIPTVLGITRRSKADHLVGIWSPSVRNSRLVYNSAYLIANDGRIADRYDKTILLDFLERPLNGGLFSVLPFLNTSRYDNILPGRSQNVITSGKARVGVLICNESLSEEMYERYEKARANLLVVMSNDAWFENTPLQALHFYIAGIEALMVGRDVIVNCNRGIVGILRSNGDIESFPQSNTARVVNCVAHLSSKTTVYSELKDFTVPFYAMLVFLSIVMRRK